MNRRRVDTKHPGPSNHRIDRIWTSKRRSQKRGRNENASKKQFACDVCEKSFSAKNNLTYHKRIHTGEKPFKCGQCEKCFRQVTHLNVHARLHTGVTPFECEKCGKGFRQKSALDFHERKC